MRLEITKYTTGTEIMAAQRAISADFKALCEERESGHDALTSEEWLDDGYNKVDISINYESRFNALGTEASFYSYALKMIAPQRYKRNPNAGWR